jgi:hypothetical protein
MSASESEQTGCSQSPELPRCSTLEKLKKRRKVKWEKDSCVAFLSSATETQLHKATNAISSNLSHTERSNAPKKRAHTHTKKKNPPFLFTPKAGEAKKRTRGGRLQTLALGRSNVVRQPQPPDPRAPAFAIPLPSRGGNPALCCAARCARTGIHGIVGATRLVVVGPRWWRIRETRHGALPQVLLPQAARRAP